MRNGVLLLITYKLPPCYLCSNHLHPASFTGWQWTWPQNSDITVNISADFGDANSLAGCIRQAFVNWANNPNTAAGVRYVTFNYGTTAGGPNTIYVARTPPPTDPVTGGQPQAQVDPTFNTTNTNLQSAIVRVHPDVTNCNALMEAMAHDSPNC